jgi:osmoprotectant transport system substrate-binding protein
VRKDTRVVRILATAAVLTLALAACGSSGSSGASGSDTTTTPSGASANTVASTMVLGGAPECPTRPYCLPGLEKTYGLKFKSFKPLDAGGPLTANALKGGAVQVGELFTTSGVIAANGWVLLKDDKNLQPADNVTPVLNNTITTAYGQPLTDLVNSVSAKITTAGLTDLNKQTDIDQKDPNDVAQTWLKDNDFIPATKPAAKSGPKIVVGSADFTEDETLADIYAGVLEANGYSVGKKLKIGTRELYVPALKNGTVGFIPDYAGSLLAFLNPKAPSSTDPATNATALAAALAPFKLTALKSSSAQDVNGFVVTKATADKYGLVNLSDLAKQAPAS